MHRSVAYWYLSKQERNILCSCTISCYHSFAVESKMFLHHDLTMQFDKTPGCAVVMFGKLGIGLVMCKVICSLKNCDMTKCSFLSYHTPHFSVFHRSFSTIKFEVLA